MYVFYYKKKRAELLFSFGRRGSNARDIPGRAPADSL
jgi:hypothetical protein